MKRQQNTRERQPANDEGIALVIALVFIVLLTVLVVDFTYEMRVEATLVEAQETDLQAYLAAKSAIAAGLGLLAADIYVGEGEAVQTGKDGIYDSLDEEWAHGIPLAPMNEGIMQCLISDEFGKINLNALIAIDDGGNEIVNERLVEAVRAVFSFRGDETDFDEIVDCLLDWLDSDDDARPNGYEDDYYTGLETPFNCKNGSLDNLEELLLLPGVTPKVYFGDPEKEELPLSEILTVHGHPKGRVNLNTAAYPTLVALFSSDGCGRDAVAMAQNVVDKLEQQGPFLTLDEIQQYDIYCTDTANSNTNNQNTNNNQNNQNANQDRGNPPPVDPNADIFEINSSVFRLHGDGQCAEARVRIEAFIWRDTAGIGQEQLFRIIDWRVIR